MAGKLPWSIVFGRNALTSNILPWILLCLGVSSLCSPSSGANTVQQRVLSGNYRKLLFSLRGGEKLEPGCGGLPFDDQYAKWFDVGDGFYRSDDSDVPPTRPPLVDTVLSTESIDTIIKFVGSDRMIACYSGMGYAESWIKAKAGRPVHCSDVMPQSSLRWTGNLITDMELESIRLSTRKAHYMDVMTKDAVRFLKKDYPNCENTTLFCFMPAPGKSDFGKAIRIFKEQGGRKIVVAGTFAGEDGDKCGDKEGWEELTTNWDKHFETHCSDLTPIRLTLWEIPNR